MQVSSLPARSRDFHVLSPAADSTVFLTGLPRGDLSPDSHKGLCELPMAAPCITHPSPKP